MIKPTIHLNGTSANQLTESYLDAHRAVNAAMDALHKAQPNPRDYYVQEGDAIQRSQDEHRARIIALKTISDEMMSLAEHCSDFIKP